MKCHAAVKARPPSEGGGRNTNPVGRESGATNGSPADDRSALEEWRAVDEGARWGLHVERCHVNGRLPSNPPRTSASAPATELPGTIVMVVALERPGDAQMFAEKTKLPERC